jgi:hypothetical protein
VLRTEPFDIYYYTTEERMAREAARMAERWYARLSSRKTPAQAFRQSRLKTNIAAATLMITGPVGR